MQAAAKLVLRQDELWGPGPALIIELVSQHCKARQASQPSTQGLASMPFIIAIRLTYAELFCLCWVAGDHKLPSISQKARQYRVQPTMRTQYGKICRHSSVMLSGSNVQASKSSIQQIADWCEVLGRQMFYRATERTMGLLWLTFGSHMEAGLVSSWPSGPLRICPGICAAALFLLDQKLNEASSSAWLH